MTGLCVWAEGQRTRCNDEICDEEGRLSCIKWSIHLVECFLNLVATWEFGSKNCTQMPPHLIQCTRSAIDIEKLSICSCSSASDAEFGYKSTNRYRKMALINHLCGLRPKACHNKTDRQQIKLTETACFLALFPLLDEGLGQQYYRVLWGPKVPSRSVWLRVSRGWQSNVFWRPCPAGWIRSNERLGQRCKAGGHKHSWGEVPLRTPALCFAQAPYGVQGEAGINLSTQLWYLSGEEYVNHHEKNKTQVLTCLATVLRCFILPFVSSSKQVPIGAAVEVTTWTDWHKAHSEDKASPRKPNVSSDERSLYVVNLEVWCFSPGLKRPTQLKAWNERGQHIPIESWSSSVMPEPLSITSIPLSPYCLSLTSSS